MEFAAGAFGVLLRNLANANRLKDKEALPLFRIVPGVDQPTALAGIELHPGMKIAVTLRHLGDNLSRDGDATFRSRNQPLRIIDVRLQSLRSRTVLTISNAPTNQDKNRKQE